MMLKYSSMDIQIHTQIVRGIEPLVNYMRFRPYKKKIKKKSKLNIIGNVC